MSIEYAIIVKNKTRLEALKERFNTTAQAKFFIEHSGGNFEDYETEHENFHDSLSSVQRQLSKVIKNKIVERSFLPSFLFNDKQLVICIGQDGLVANTAKYVNEIPIIGINPDAKRYDGVLLPFDPTNFILPVENVMANKYKSRICPFAEATLNDGQKLLAFNDLFIGVSSHVSARYSISYGENTEEQSSSGVLVSTPSGATGWLSSVFNMVSGIRNLIEKESSKKKAIKLKNDQLYFVVREPFESRKTRTGIIAGTLSGETKLTIESYMPANGVIFSDGIESDFLNFNSGAIATIGISEQRAKLVVPGS